jgi:hypothetical protein
MLQWIYAPLLYCGLGLKIRIRDIPIVFVDKANANIRVNPLAPG